MSVAQDLDVLASLRAKGLVQQCTHDDALREWLATGQRTFYVGYDPTGASLHTGHLVTLMALRQLVAHGHRPIVLVGGGTARIGDPSERTSERPMLDEATIDANARKIAAQIAQILHGQPLIEVNNAEWLGSLSLLTFLRETGRHFSVNRMLTAESYRSRLETGLSFLEFNYQLLQAHDFFELLGRHECRLQLGGDDQWSNILAGIELCRRRAGTQCFGLTVPLLTTADGRKMGKTASGAVWLDADKTSPADFYQYWVNVADDDVPRFLRLFTDLPADEIAAIPTPGSGALNAAKSVLAFEVTKLVHGQEAAHQAHQAAQAAFGGRVIAAGLLASSTISRQPRPQADDAVTHHLQAAALQAGLPLTQLLVALGWVKSNNEARRAIAQASVSFADQAITDPHHQLTEASFQAGPQFLRLGKKRRIRLVLSR